MNEQQCMICLRKLSQNEIIPGHGIRHELERLIINDYPEWNDSSYICKDDYEKYRVMYVEKLIKEEYGKIEMLESEVIQTIKDSEIISSNINTKIPRYKLGERLSDGIASFGGSWKFIIIFFIILLSWIVINTHLILSKPYDPYPFILLNLILSCIAAIQAPIIMMSQNRQEVKDRIRSENDYKINLKSEIEIRTLHEKMDHLLLEQWSKMIEIQQFQIDLLKEIREEIKTDKPSKSTKYSAE